MFEVSVYKFIAYFTINLFNKIKNPTIETKSEKVNLTGLEGLTNQLYLLGIT